VTVAGETVGEIGPGLLILLGVEKGDDEQKAQRLRDRVLGYRIFSDENGKMNLNVQQAGGSVLVVSQFTLAADTQKGMRPGFSAGAAPEEAERLYNYFVDCCREKGVVAETGRFAADMQVALVNDWPVTFWLQVCSGRNGRSARKERTILCIISVYLKPQKSWIPTISSAGKCCASRCASRWDPKGTPGMRWRTIKWWSMKTTGRSRSVGSTSTRITRRRSASWPCILPYRAKAWERWWP